MTTITLESPAATGRLEELVDRLLAALFPPQPEPAPSPVRTVHDARRLRQAGDLDGALSAFTRVGLATASDSELRRLYAEWLDIARRRFAGGGAVLYSPATGRAAVLVEHGGDGASLEVAAVLGLRWPVGKQVFSRSLRGLRSLHKGGESWS